MCRNGEQFQFSVNDHALNSKGEFRCAFCYRNFVMTEVTVCFRGMVMCPSCILSGPGTIASMAERNAGNKNRLMTWGETKLEMKEMALEYRAVARAFRRGGCFLKIGGYDAARAIARAWMNKHPKRIQGKAA